MCMSYLIVIFTYLILLVVVGFVVGRKQVKNSEDYVVAGRKLPFIIVVGTLLATWFGAGTVTGTAGFAYSNGPLAGFGLLGVMALGVIVLSFVAGIVRQKKHITVPQLLESKFGPKVGFVSAIIVVLANVGTVAVQFTAAGSLISTISGIDTNVAVIMCAVVIILLAFSGGMVTVAYSDAVSILIMIGSMIIAIPFLISATGYNILEIFQNLPEAQSTATGSLTTAQYLAYIIPGAFLVMGDQNMLMRFSSAKDSKTAKKSAVGMIFGVLLIAVLIVLVVTPAIYLYSTMEDPSVVIFQLAFSNLPFVVGAALLTGAASFIITTCDSYLLASSTNITYDIWVRHFKKDATDEEKMRFCKWGILFIGALGYIMTTFFTSILDAQMYTYTIYGTAITPAILLGLLWKKATGIGAMSGIVFGSAFTLIWDLGLGNPWGMKPALIGIPVTFLIIVVVSLLTQKPETADAE